MQRSVDAYHLAASKGTAAGCHRTGSRALIRFIAAGFISTVQERLKKNDCSPWEIAEMLLAMMMKLQ